MYWQAPQIDVSGIKPSNLTNAGLLIATLMSQGQEVIEVKLGQISIDEESRAWTMARLQEESLRILE